MYVARIGETRNVYRILVGKPKERDHWEHQCVGGLTILKWTLDREDGMVWIGLIWLRIGTSGGLLEHGKEHSGSIKCWEILE
jgi:hypothetical protein